MADLTYSQIIEKNKYYEKIISENLKDKKTSAFNLKLLFLKQRIKKYHKL